MSYRNYRIRTGTASFALGIVAGASFVISPMVSYFGYTYIARDFFHHPWNILFAILALMTLVLFGVMQIVWGIAHIKSRKYTASRLAIVTGTMLIASGPLTVSTYAGPLLFFVSQILTIIFFLTPKMPQRARMSEIDFACKILGKAPDEIAKGNMDEIRAMVALALRHRVHRKRGSIPMIIRRLTLLNAFWIRNGRMVKDPYGGIPGPLRTEIESYTKERKSWVLGKIKK